LPIQLRERFFENFSDSEKWLYSLPTEGVGFSYFGGKCSRQAFTINLPSRGNPFPWPDSPNFEESLTAYFNLQQSIGKSLLDTISYGINRTPSLSTILDDENDTENPPEYSNSVVFVRHYASENTEQKVKPTSAKEFWPKDHTREHTDSGILTLKPLSEIAALQVYQWNERTWVNVEIPSSEKCRKNSLVILVGEELSYLTNGMFKAAIHRVAFHEKDTRISMPFQLRGNRSKYSELGSSTSNMNNNSLKMIGLVFSM